MLNASKKPSLIKATLATLHAFLSWIPLGYIFESNLVEVLLTLFPQAPFRNAALQCLTEVRHSPLVWRGICMCKRTLDCGHCRYSMQTSRVDQYSFGIRCDKVLQAPNASQPVRLSWVADVCRTYAVRCNEKQGSTALADAWGHSHTHVLACAT